MGIFNDEFTCLALKEDKSPLQGWKQYGIGTMERLENAGVIVPEPFVVVDVDDRSESDKLTRLLMGEGIKCQIMNTDKGVHYWFKSDEPLKNAVRATCAIGLKLDYRSYGKRSYVCVKRYGVEREWLSKWDWGELDNIPRWLLPASGVDSFNLVGMKAGEGRNDTLYKYQITLTKNKLGVDECRYITRLINKYIIADPLGERELDVILRDESYSNLVVNDLTENNKDNGLFDSKGKLILDSAVNLICNTHDVIYYMGDLYIKHNNLYEQDDYTIPKFIEQIHPNATITVHSNLIAKVKARQYRRTIERNPDKLLLRHGVLDLTCGALIQPIDKDVFFTRLDVDYRRRAYDQNVDEMINKVFQGDHQLIDLFDEILGYGLMTTSMLDKFFVFTGSGSNGKSTVLQMMKEFYGRNNCSSLSLQDLEDKFKPTRLVNSWINLGDDIPETMIMDASKVKSLTTGGTITIEQKYKVAFDYTNTCKLIFSCNVVPKTKDKTDGFYRRLCIIPFNAKFSKDDPDFDPRIKDKITTERAKSYLLQRAMKGIERLIDNQQFTKPKVCKEIMNEYKIKQSTVLSWIRDKNMTVEKNLVEKDVDYLYESYIEYCKQNGYRTLSRTKDTFISEIYSEFHLNYVRSNNGKWVFRLT
jgi:putative DNA primase/helicase